MLIPNLRLASGCRHCDPHVVTGPYICACQYYCGVWGCKGEYDKFELEIE